jgi:putative ABC transport system substrate-binding protein
MRRRGFLGLIGGAAAWPLAARAQQAERMRHVGMLNGLASSEDDPGARDIVRPFRKGLLDTGWIEDRNVQIDYRYGGGSLARIDAAASELVALGPDLIYAVGLPVARALQQKTRTIPIIFTLVADPVGFGLVSSLNHPSGNVTGFMVWELSIGGKWVEVLRQIKPDLNHVGIIYNPDTCPYARPLVESVKAAARDEVAVSECPIRAVGEIEAVAASLEPADRAGLLIIPEPFTNAQRDGIIAQSARFRLATVNPSYGATKRGALVSYTYSLEAMIRQSVTYIDRILKGEPPQNLPVQTPTKFELSINLKTARALGLMVPDKLLALADEVIE